MATQVRTLNADAFGYLVGEHKLDTWTAGGYRYACRKEQDGWVLYRTFESWSGVPVSVIVTADPGAGLDPAATVVPVGKRWLVLGVKTNCVASANAANRLPGLTILGDGTNQTYYANCAGVFIANESVTISFAPGQTPYDGSAVYFMAGPLPSPGLELAAGASIQVVTAAINVTDNFGPCYITYKEVAVP